MAELPRCWPTLLLAALPVLIAGCGQTGKLYLPEPAGEIVTRPTQTPPPESGGSPSSPQTVDSPATPPTPAPEVTEPEKQKKKTDPQPQQPQ